MAQCLKAWALKVHRRPAFGPDSASSSQPSGPWFLHLQSKHHNTNCLMESFLFFPNLNLFSYEKQLFSSKRTNHSQKTINSLHSRLNNSVNKEAKHRRGRPGLRDRNSGVLPSSAFIICSRVTEMSRKSSHWNVSPVKCTSWLDTSWNQLMALENQQGILQYMYQSSLNVCPICMSWRILNVLCHHEQVS